MAPAAKSKGLGRGLSSLMGDDEVVTALKKTPPPKKPAPQKTQQAVKDIKAAAEAKKAEPREQSKQQPKAAPAKAAKSEAKAAPNVLPIASLAPNALQPRTHFAPEQIRELADSIKKKGMLQPILVRKGSKAGQYEIVAGERRWRAAQKAKLHEVPVVLKQLNNQEVLQIAIIENIQREDLTPVDEARAYERLIKDFQNTQEDIAKLVSKSRSHIANLTRLLTLPKDVIELIEKGKLSMGHARPLVGKANASELAKKIIKDKLTAREAEALAADKKPAQAAAKKGKAEKDADTLALEKSLQDGLGLKVDISHRGKSGGRLTVRYKTLEQLDDICGRLVKRS